MAEHRQLARPPLKEAVIDLRLAQGKELPNSVVKEAAEQLPGFESRVQLWHKEMTLQIRPESPVSASTKYDEPYGWRYATADGSRVVQLRTDGITYSVIRGYTTWAEAKEAANALWRQYCESWKPVEVGRVAVRYINVFELPFGADFDLYFSAAPRVPPGAPAAVSGFLHRVVIPFSEDGMTQAMVTQALEQPKGTTSAVVLDIDVWRSGRYHTDSPEIWRALDRLRDIKNLLFFRSLTEKALEPYI